MNAYHVFAYIRIVKNNYVYIMYLHLNFFFLLEIRFTKDSCKRICLNLISKNIKQEINERYYYVYVNTQQATAYHVRNSSHNNKYVLLYNIIMRFNN